MGNIASPPLLSRITDLLGLSASLIYGVGNGEP